MARRKKAIQRVISKMPKSQKPVSITYNVYIDNIKVEERPKEPNSIERILKLGTALIRMLVMWLA